MVVMSKYEKETKMEASRTPADRLRDLERWERDKLGDSSWTLSPEIMNMMIDMCTVKSGDAQKYDPVKIFNWCKGIQRIQKQDNGVALHCNKLTAENIFDKIPEPLLGHFGTRNMATVFEGKVVKYYSAPNVKEPLTPKGEELLAQAKRASGIF